MEKEGRSYFLEIVILLMGVGGLVRTIPSSTYFFFFTGESGNGCFSSVQIPHSVHKTVMDGKTVEQMRLSTSLNLD